MLDHICFVIIIFVEKKVDLNTSTNQYEAIMDAKHKIKVQVCKKRMDLTPVWKDLEECYWKDLKVNKYT